MKRKERKSRKEEERKTTPSQTAGERRQPLQGPQPHGEAEEPGADQSIGYTGEGCLI